MDYLFMFFAIVSFSAQSIFTKKYQIKSSGGVYYGAFYSMVYGLILCMAFFMLSSFKISFTFEAVLWALIYAVSTVLCQICVIVALQKGSVGIVSMFSLSGGLIIPFMAGVLFWDESIGKFKIIGCILIILAFIYKNLSDRKEEKSNMLFVLLCSVIFLTNGFVSVASKAHQISANRVGTNNFLFICTALTTVVSFLIVVLSYRKNRIENINVQRFKITYLLFIFGYALMNGVGNYFSLTAAKTLDASIQFPILSALIVCITSVIAFVVFKEKLRKRDVIAIAVNVIGITCFIFAI
ncbi:MAG: EamA family transporter [Clostridia bacterium]